jgi:hypothetical protein
MLSDFFRLNLPYGLVKDDSGGWMAFNREYKPLGCFSMPTDTPCINPRYKGLSDAVLLEAVAKDEDAVRRNTKGEICKIFLYNDKTCPATYPDDSALWRDY